MAPLVCRISIRLLRHQARSSGCLMAGERPCLISTCLARRHVYLLGGTEPDFLSFFPFSLKQRRKRGTPRRVQSYLCLFIIHPASRPSGRRFCLPITIQKRP